MESGRDLFLNKLAARSAQSAYDVPQFQLFFPPFTIVDVKNPLYITCCYVASNGAHLKHILPGFYLFFWLSGLEGWKASLVLLSLLLYTS